MDENRPQRSRVDDVLDLLDHGLQRSTDLAFPTDPGDPSTCWRCLVRPGEGPAGVCAGCRAFLLDETTEPEHPSLFWDEFPDAERVRVDVRRFDRGTLTLRALDDNGEPVGEPIVLNSRTFTFAAPDFDDASWSDA